VRARDVDDPLHEEQGVGTVPVHVELLQGLEDEAQTAQLVVITRAPPTADVRGPGPP
jgi:hypothetical protein